MLSNKTRFSLASFIILFAFALCLAPITAEAQDPTLTWAIKPSDVVGTKLALMSRALIPPTGPNNEEITYDPQTTPPLPRGLSIRKSLEHPTVYGIVEVGSPTKTYTVTARYKDQSVTQTFDLVVHSSPEFPENLSLNSYDELPEKVFRTGEAVSFVLPAATDEDGDTVTYTLAIWDEAGLPAGLSFDASTRTVSGTITAVGEHYLVYTAVDGGSHASDRDTKIYQIITIAQAVVVVEDEDVDVVKDPDVPGSLEGENDLDKEISQRIPTIEDPDSTPRNPDVEVQDPALTWATKPNNAVGAGTKGTHMSYLLTPPTGPSKDAITYDSQTDPPLPRGLSIEKVFGYPTVYGIVEVGSPTKTYTVTARYKDQSVTQTFDLVVHSSPEFPENLSLNSYDELPEKVFRTGEVVSFVLPAATDEDGDTVTYTLAIREETGLPAGLSFDASTRTVSGTITTVGEHYLVYTAVDGGSHASDRDTEIYQIITIVAASFRVIGGTAEDYTDSQGRVWRGVQKLNQNMGGWVEKQPRTKSRDAKLTAESQAKAAAAGYDAKLFEAVSWAKHPNTIQYQFNTGNGTFDVTYLCGQYGGDHRGFAILIEDTVVEPLYVTPGKEEIDIKTYRGIKVTDGKLNIQLKGDPQSSLKNVNPMFSALEVVLSLSGGKLDDPAAPISVVLPERLTIAKGEPFLSTLVPEETALLANYPNPFNPETWIPYQLAKPADVTVHIYGSNGSLVRTLTLGHQDAGMYHGRSRAAYWDGKNALGEPVASGVYFYTLTAGDFTATRKMLIRK